MEKLLALVLIFTLVGCVGQPVSDGNTVKTPESTKPSAQTPAPTSIVGPTENNTIAYSNLTIVQQNAFDQAITGRTQFLDQETINSPYVEGDYFVRSAARVFTDHDYVVKNNVLYIIKYDGNGGDAYASYLIRATEEEPNDEATVVQFESLSQEAHAPVESAIQNGSHGVPPGKWDSLPQDISDADFIEYNGTTYRLSVVYGDEFAGILRVEKA